MAALLGRPNAGKSSLLNRLLGEPLAIVSPRPQTTRSRIVGILTRPGVQLLLVDTPGLHEGSSVLSEMMNAAALDAARDCDVAVLLVDPTRSWPVQAAEATCRAGAAATPRLLVGTKLDLPRARAAPWPPAEASGGWDAMLRVSASTGEGVEALLGALLERLPPGPPFYDADQLTDRPLRFLAAEHIREAAMAALEQELPYALAVEVDAFREERPDLTRIRATLLVTRPSQKRIVVGAGGAKVREIGIRARRALEERVGTRVHLELWVKVERDWQRQRKRLKSLGYF